MGAKIKGCVVGEWGKDLTLTAKDTDGNIQDIKKFASSAGGSITTFVRSPRGQRLVELTSTLVNTGTDGKYAFCFDSDNYLTEPGSWEGQTNFELTTELSKTYIFELYVEGALK